MYDSKIMETDDLELRAMTSLLDALKALQDDEARTRCLTWVTARFGLSFAETPGGQSPILRAASAASTASAGSAPGDALEDIVERTEDGRYRVIARDLKARSTNDAAVRLTYLVLYANETLEGQAKTSSRKIVVPVLNEWRAYDGNTRAALAKNPGIKRDGDLLSLDIHSRREAQNYVAQIRDERTKGFWSPTGARNRRAERKSPKKA